MQLHQITVEYVAPEDRLLLHLVAQTGERTSLWITRRLLLALHGPLHQAVSRAHVAAEWGAVPLPDGAADLLAESARAQALREADFATPPQTATDAKPLLPGAVPVVGEVTLGVPVGAEAAGQLAIRWRTTDGRDVELNVPAAAATALQTLLVQGAERGGWGLAAPDDKTARTQEASGPRFMN
ncbi:hypothetical protein DFR41_110178 [Pseudacidovorax intermedius]|uniref:Uncharacterized protein n=1 Tax=Pseudacidovorax intermedius TaxID=433924 RepID=A0A370F8Q5_9BURK|nr:hypothetical protein [Pseudacidovorax intermedius]RDI20770.1 hypothetical protein DFR41_110178 [Pseudacidovorax intermedius]